MTDSLTGETRVTGLFGFPVSHSHSPAMQNAAFRELGLNCVYVPFRVNLANLEAAVQSLRALDILGVNLTIPHKERVIEYLDRVDEDARRIGSVNTILNSGGMLTGYSTDGPGFIRALERVWRPPGGASAVVLGAGGAARATTFSLAKEGARVCVANRTPSRAEALARELSEALESGGIEAVPLESEAARRAIGAADLLVNCTSVGMYPNTDALPVPPEWLHPGLFVYDQVYNPVETRLLAAASAAGASVSGGVGMLVFQGALSFEIWTGRTPSFEVMERAVLAASSHRG